MPSAFNWVEFSLAKKVLSAIGHAQQHLQKQSEWLQEKKKGELRMNPQLPCLPVGYTCNSVTQNHYECTQAIPKIFTLVMRTRLESHSL